MLTDKIGRLPPGDPLAAHLDAMRAACRLFLNRVHDATVGGRRLWVSYREIDHREVPLVVGIGELRAAMGIQVGLVATAHDLDVPATLVEVLPAPPDDGTDLDLDLEGR